MRRRGSTAIAGAVVVAMGLVGALVVPSLLDPVEAAPGCGTLDRPETGVPGDVPLADQISGRADLGYNCGLAVVGYNSLGGRGGNANMAWAGDCAYVSGKGIAVIDVRDPAHPKHISTIHGSGSDVTIETLHAVDAPDRSILVAGRYGLYNFAGPDTKVPVDIWDVRDCAHPVLLSTLEMPSNVHNLTLTADGKTMWSTLPLQAADLTDPRHPKFLGNIEHELAAQGQKHYQYAHEAWVSPDGTRLYAGGQIGFVGDEELLVIDIEGWPQRKAKVLGSTPTAGHSIRPATIGGQPFLLTSDESVINPTSKGCLPEMLTPVGGASKPYLTDITDEQHPFVRSQYLLPINQPVHCPEQLLSGVNASVHYQDPDDPLDTTFMMASMWHAGLRIIDVRDPDHPSEVAYFNPGRFLDPNGLDGAGVDPPLELQSLQSLDQAWAHSRYRPETGHIWLATRSGGFWVLELEPQVRAALGLPPKPAAHPRGGSPRPRESYLAVDPFAGAFAAYCTINLTATPLVGALTPPL